MASQVLLTRMQIKYLLQLINKRPVTPSRDFYEEDMFKDLTKILKQAYEKEEKNG